MTATRLLSGRYRLEATIGQGGMGVVYRATDTVLRRAVAVKLVSPEDGETFDDEVAGRFLREAQRTARIQHENIVEVYDLGQSDDGGLFFVMELLEGESLSARLKREGRLSVTESVHIARQVCSALFVAHGEGIVHRDLKPANVMLLYRAGVDSFVKVLDFGVAKSMTPEGETQLTRTGMLVGTIEYMAPEQIAGRGVDARTDVYALGVLLYRMLTGTPVFREAGVPALIHNHLNVIPDALGARSPDANIPPELDQIVLRCLEKRPERRYHTMLDVSAALATLVEESLAKLPSLEYETVQDDPASWGRTEVAKPWFDHDATLEIRNRAPLAPVETRVERTNRAPAPAPVMPPPRRLPPPVPPPVPTSGPSVWSKMRGLFKK